MSETNPFTSGTMITDPARFIGRRAELEIITARLNGGQPQGSSIVGPRRIGKSSLLHYLYHPRDDETLRANARLHLTYLDAQQGECETPERFLITLMQALLATLQLDRRTTTGRQLSEWRDRLAEEASCGWDEARAILKLLREIPVHPIICLDEFEALRGAAFDNRFFDGLRSWANAGLLTWITASAQPLAKFAEEHSYTSPFFNLLATVTLGDLTEVEATQLLDQANPTSHAFTNRERRWLRTLAGTHPYHLQSTGERLWIWKSMGRKATLRALRYYLCAQPNPPHYCTQQSWVRRFNWQVVGLLAVIFLLMATVAWRDPPFVQQIGKVCWEIFKLVGSYLSDWQDWGDLGSRLGGIFLLIGGLVIVLKGIIQKQSPLKILRDLWQRWIP